MTKLQYDEVQHMEHTKAHAQRAKLQGISKDTFKPGHHVPLLPLRSCAGKDQKAQFHTQSPWNEAKAHGQVALWRHCEQSKLWGFVDNAWYIGLVSPGQLVF